MQDKVNDLFANGVGTLGMDIGSIFFASDELLRVQELSVGASSNLINDCGFQIYKHCAGHMLPVPVSLKKVLKKLYPPPVVLSLHLWPLGWMPCSRQ